MDTTTNHFTPLALRVRGNEVQLVLVPDSLLKHIYMLPVVRESIVHDDMKVQILSLICIENIILD